LPSLPIEKLDLLQNKLYLVGNTQQKFSTATYGKELFKELPIIYREKGSGTRQTMERFIESHRIPIGKKMELTSNEAVKHAVLSGLGYSIMPLIGIKNELHNEELQIVPVKGLPIKTVWRLIWLRGKKHSPVAQSFLDYTKREKSTIVKNTFDWYEKY
jgi:DNA-binding transcriptional LysR family regulator